MERHGLKPHLCLILAIALVALATYSASCSREEAGYDFRRAAVPVTVAKIIRKSMPVELHAIGTVQPFSTVGIKSQISGQVISVYFREGDDVKRGQPLFTIDPRSYEAALAQAKANLQRDLAQEKEAETDEMRYLALLRERIGTQQQYDQAHATADALRAAVAADRAAVRTAEVNLSYTDIRSPIDGRTGDLKLHMGNVVKANADDAMVVINQIRPIYVNFAVPEKYLAEIQKEAARRRLLVRAAPPGEEQAPAVGELSFIDNAVDKTTGTIGLKGQFENADRRLWPGLFVNSALVLNERPDALVVPSQAVQTGQGGNFVYVVDRKLTAEARPVAVGESLDGQTVIERGVEVGEMVVTDGQFRLAPGARVIIKSAPAQSSAS